VDIEILETKDNTLLKRKEIRFRIDHLNQPSPDRIVVKDKLAAMQSAKPELTFIKQMKPVFGLPEVQGLAIIYNDAELAAKLEPNYSRIRNLPKDQRADAWKKIKDGRKKKKKKE